MDDEARFKAHMQGEMALHFLLKYKEPDLVRKAILDQPLMDPEEEKTNEEFMEIAGDPYFGTIGLPELPDMPPPGMPSPPMQFGELEPPPPPSSGFTLPAFPITQG